MNIKRTTLLLICFFAIAPIFCIRTVAFSTGFEITPMSTEEKSNFVSRFDIAVIEKEPAKKTITCFDVNEKHMIAIGQGRGNLKTICVYSKDGVFQYGYTFDCNGSFGIEWDGENINVYLCRSDIVVSISPIGEILDTFRVSKSEANNSYRNNILNSTKRTVGNTEYRIKNNRGVILNWTAFSYSQLTFEDEYGVETVIYYAPNAQRAEIIEQIVCFSFCVVVSTITLLGVTMHMKRLRKKYQHTSENNHKL